MCFLPVTELSRRVEARALTITKLTEAFLERIRRYDHELHAFTLVTEELALQRAHLLQRELEQGVIRGPLHGIPYCVKDLFDVQGLATTANSLAFQDRVAPGTAFVVQRMDDAGAILLGKNTLHELAYGGVSEDLPWPSARNPWDTSRDTGGSSSGTGAAVAAGMAAAGLGTDTGGSVRNPAAHCGLTGVKPSFGRISRSGVLQNSWTLDHCGPIARTCEDCAVILDAIDGYDAADDSSLNWNREPIGPLSGRLKGLRIGVITNWFREDLPAPAHVQEAMGEFGNVLRSLGATLTDVRAASLEEYATTKAVIQMPEIRTEYADQLEQGLPFGKKLLARLDLAQSVTVSDYIRARSKRRRMIREYLELAAPFDAIITAGPYGPAPFVADLDRDWVFNRPEITVPFSLIGVPAMSLCIGFSPEGLPLSGQISAPHFQEAKMLNIGHAYQQATGWHHRHPKL